MIACSKSDDPRVALPYLRQDVLANTSMIMSLERNVPAVPREVWVAKQPDAATAGVMVAEDFSEWISVSLQADVPEAVSVMIRCLERDRKYRFVIPGGLWESVEPLLSDAAPPSETIAMMLSPTDLCMFTSPGEIRLLSAADRHLTDLFPPPKPGEFGANEPGLSRFVEWAEAAPEKMAVFGSLVKGEIVSFVAFGWVIDSIWEVEMIRTPEERRRKGFAKAVLSHASDELLRRGAVPHYRVRATNLASLRTAEAVGYREIFRVLACEAFVRTVRS